MKHWIQTAFAVLTLSTIGYAASGQAGGQTMNGMDKPTVKTYTGCVAAGATAGSFVLTHAAEASKGNDAMAKDSTSTDAMGHSMASDAKGKTLALEGKAVDFSKHVGHQVSVSGTPVAPTAGAKPDTMSPMSQPDAMAKMDAPPTKFTVTSFKMIATSCKSM